MNILKIKLVFVLVQYIVIVKNIKHQIFYLYYLIIKIKTINLCYQVVEEIKQEQEELVIYNKMKLVGKHYKVNLKKKLVKIYNNLYIQKYHILIYK